MKSLLLLWNKLADESAGWCCTSATKDIKTVLGRVEHEGLSFLTITLPQFGKDFEKSLDQGVVDRRLFTGFQRKGELPRFLGGFLDRVFDRDSGLLLTDPCIDAILAIRQLTLMFGKIALPCSDARIRDAMRGFVECEEDVQKADSQRSSAMVADFQRVSAMLFSRSFSVVDHQIYNSEVVMRHGPGSTADRLLGNQKFMQKNWTSRLDRVFPIGDYLIPNHRFYDELDEMNILEPGSEIPVRVITVPKTLKTPRIIGIEPTAMQFAQQGVLSLILNALARDHNLATIIGFDDQTPNQRMAQRGSSDGSLATLDLSEASDRVSNQLVRSMFHLWPHLHEAIDATRSRKADIPGYGVKRLAKYASMGSALCFPMEAMVFTTIIFIGIERELNRPLRRSDVNRLSSEVRVYGDDIIIPVDYVPSVVRALESFGIRVNSGKSFWTGRFRESCGREYYDGNDVSIVRVRTMFPTQRQDATGVISTVSLRNQLYKAGYWKTCQWLDDQLRRVLKYYPVVAPSSPVQGRHSFLGYESEKECKSLHKPLVRGYVVDARIPKNPLSDSGALLKWFLKQARNGLDDGYWETKNHHFGVQPNVDNDHLERSGRPQAVNLKLRWTSPY